MAKWLKQLLSNRAAIFLVILTLAIGISVLVLFIKILNSL